MPSGKKRKRHKMSQKQKIIVSLSDFNKEQTCKAPHSLSGLFFVYENYCINPVN